MIKQFPKGQAVPLSANFSTDEFDCHCPYPECDHTLVDTDVIDALEALRKKTGRIDIDSGYRCSRWNKEKGGKVGSIHLQGKAADIVTPLSADETASLAEKIPLFKNGGIGRYPGFTHVDGRGYRARWRFTA